MKYSTKKIINKKYELNYNKSIKYIKIKNKKISKIKTYVRLIFTKTKISWFKNITGNLILYKKVELIKKLNIKFITLNFWFKNEILYKNRRV